jgi:hypothetical protein
MKKPVLLKVKELENIKANKTFLLKQYGFESIYDAKKSLGGNADSAYLDMFNQYNNTVERVNNDYRKNYLKKLTEYNIYKLEQEIKLKMKMKKLKEQAKLRIKNNEILTKNLFNLHQGRTKSVIINIREFLKPYKSFKEAIEKILEIINKMLYDKLVNIEINGVIYSLSSNFYDRLMQQLIQEEDTEGSDKDFIASLEMLNNMTISLFEKTNKNKKDNGAFFKYIHKTHFDFTRYDIYDEVLFDYQDNCLIIALENGGLSEEKLNELRIMSNSKNIPVCKFEEICKKFNIQINLKRFYQNKDRITIFGKSKEIYNIGLIDEHYFINELTTNTRFSIERYDEIKDKNRCNEIFGISENKYKRDIKRFIDSYDLVKILIENKETLLTELNKEDLKHTQYYDKVETELINLNYDMITEGNNFRKIEIETQEDKKETKNVFFDFEAYTDENGKHIPYLCRYKYNEHKEVFYGKDCGLQMLIHLSKNDALSNREKRKISPWQFFLSRKSKQTGLSFEKCAYMFKHEYNKNDYIEICEKINSKSNITLIAHNSTYDITFIKSYLININEIPRGNKIINLQGEFNNLTIKVKDSYLLIPMGLKSFPKTFNIENCVKEVISYEMYNKSDCLIRRFIPIEEGLNWIKNEKKDEKQFLDNIKRWNLQIEDKYDCIEYSSKYCELDCEILEIGYNTFKKWMLELVNINIDDVLTIASLAHKYIINENCYDGVFQLSGVPQTFIQKCVVGGRVMTNSNKKIIFDKYTHKRLNDFDAVSLYPSAMKRMDGFLKGLPKVITNLSYDDIKNKDGYFIEIKIKNIGIHRQFPLLSYKDENGIRQFTNDLIGKTIFIDKIALEDAINFQKVEFDVLRGYYFDEGFNTKINETINNLFEARKKLKKQKNPAEYVYKLIMNSSYGKSIMKEIESEIKYFNSEFEMNVFVSRNYNWVESRNPIENSKLWRVKLIKPLNEHFNIAHVGVSILSWSKRIMNEVMCLAEDKNIELYYQDTDSIHIDDEGIEILSNEYKQLYNKDLIGNEMGQFHSDFSLDGCNNIKAVRSIFLGKKCYIDELQGKDDDGKIHTDYHIRMKGIPNSCILFTADKLKKSVFELYEDLAVGKKIKFDLTEDGKKANFKYNNNSSVSTLKEFQRVICF